MRGPLLQTLGVLSDEELHRVKLELGIPTSVSIIHVRYDLGLFKPKLEGWNLDIFGVPDTAVPPGTVGMLHHYAIYRNESGTESMVLGRRPDGFDETHEIIQALSLFVFSQRLWLPPSPAYAEKYWHPTLGVRRRYGGVEGASNADVSHLSRCFEMFDDLKHFQVGGGRPAGSYDYTNADEYRRAIHADIYDVPDRARHLERAKPDVIAGWLGISESSMKRYGSRFGISPRDIKRRRVDRPNF